MKLSESILLGSTVVTPKAGVLHSSRENAGCVLGMAAIASGCTFVPLQRQIPVKDLRTVNVEDIWGPWLLRVVTRPWDCRPPITLSALRLKEITAYLFDRGSAPLPREMRIKDIIAHLFDHHCMSKRNWTSTTPIARPLRRRSRMAKDPPSLRGERQRKTSARPGCSLNLPEGLRKFPRL
jgi:hypothetical protein